MALGLVQRSNGDRGGWIIMEQPYARATGVARYVVDGRCELVAEVLGDGLQSLFRTVLGSLGRLFKSMLY